jgi:replicative DNA helicase
MVRLISDASGINSRSIKNGMLSTSNFAQIQDKCGEVYNYPFYIDDVSMELSQVVSSCRSMVRILGVQIIYIDHAGLIIVKEKAQSWEKGNIKSKTLKALQKELDIPLVLLSQVGRQAEGKHPTLADLRETGSFEEDGDTIMFLHRERVESIDDMPIHSELYVAKAKDGEIGTVNLLFYPKVTRFVDEKKESAK